MAVPIRSGSLILLACCGLARGESTSPVALSTEARSWTHHFTVVADAFDLVAHRITSVGDAFDSPGLMAFAPGSSRPGDWGEIYNNGTLATAAGSSVSQLAYDAQFVGAATDPLDFDLVVFSGETLVGSSHFVWDGTMMSPEPGTWAPTRADVVPEPQALVLLALAAGWTTRRRRS